MAKSDMSFDELTMVDPEKTFAASGIEGAGQRSQGQTTTYPHPMHPIPDQFAKTDTTAQAILTDTGLKLIREAASKATFRTIVVSQAQSIQVLPYDPNRRQARLWVPSTASGVILGPKAEVENFVNGGTVTIGAGIVILPAPASANAPLFLVYESVSEIWATSASATAGVLSLINETYGGSPPIG